MCNSSLVWLKPILISTATLSFLVSLKTGFFENFQKEKCVLWAICLHQWLPVGYVFVVLGRFLSWIWAGFKTGFKQHEIEMMLCQVWASVLRSLAASAFVLLRDLNCHITRMATHLQSPHGARKRPSQASAPTASCPDPGLPWHQQCECKALSWMLQPRPLSTSFKICAFITLG